MSNVVRFDCFEVDLDSGQLYKRGLRVKLRDQSFLVLASLLQHPGQVITRHELRQYLWHNEVFVDFDNNLNIVVARLREVLGDSPDHPRFIETLPKHGYRFIGELKPEAGEQPLRRPASRDLIACNEYMQGRNIVLHSNPSINAARKHFEKATERDPAFVEAHDALAEAVWLHAYLGLSEPRKAFATALAHALRALEIDSSRAETHALIAQFHKTVEYNWPEVHREMAIARELAPDSPLVRTRYAISELMPHARLKEAAAELEAALEIEPLSFFRRMWLGIILLLDRQNERAMEEGRKLETIAPDYSLTYFVLGAGYRYLGDVDNSIAAYRRAVEVSDGVPMTIGWLGMTLADSGQTAEARVMLDNLRSKAAREWVPPTNFAWIHLGLREIDQAFEWMQRAVEDCDQLIMPIKTYAFLDPIRGDPRFAALLQKMNLA